LAVAAVGPIPGMSPWVNQGYAGIVGLGKVGAVGAFCAWEISSGRMNILAQVVMVVLLFAGFAAHLWAYQLFSALRLFDKFAGGRGFLDYLSSRNQWRIRFEFLVCVLVTSGAVAASGADIGYVDMHLAWALMVGTAVFATASHLVLMWELCYTIVDFCGVAIDRYAAEVMGAEYLQGLISRFNVLSAVVRRAGFVLEMPLLFMTQSDIVLVALLASAFLIQVDIRWIEITMGFSALLWLVLGFALFSAVAVVNLKMDKLPILLAARHFGQEIDLSKQCAVMELQASDAGLKMFNVRIDRKSIFKVVCYVAVLSVALPTFLGRD